MIWCATSYFNPAGYASRHQNYRIFRERIGIPLVAVELSFNGSFELGKDDADILVQIAGGDVLWQKERLINVGVARLPSECQHVAWVDCDVIFGNRDWADRTQDALEQFRLVQLFRDRCNLSRGTQPDDELGGHCDSIAESVGYRIAKGTAQPDDFRCSDAPLARKTTVGLAWACRRDLIRAHGIYDACILGSGDRAILCAAMGTFDYSIAATAMHGRQIDHYLTWARRFHEAIAGEVGFVDGRIFHLWHGALENRQYARRLQELAQFDFDPFTDLILDPSGSWRWNENKPEMHKFIRGYFESRKEDN